MTTTTTPTKHFLTSSAAKAVTTSPPFAASNLILNPQQNDTNLGKQRSHDSAGKSLKKKTLMV